MPEPNEAWRFFSRLCTLFIPDEKLFWAGKTDEQKQAWREKVALCFIMLAANVGFLGFGGLIHILSCGDEQGCGGGIVGNGICSDGTCCSEYGFCGTSDEHCGSNSGRLFDRNLQFTSDEDTDIVDSVKESISDSVNHENPTCRALNTVMLAIMFTIVTILAVQCLCSLIYLLRMGRWCHKAIRGEKYKDAKVIVMVPCYNEGEDELQKTIESVRNETYSIENKLLLFVADGNVRGKNSDGADNYDTTPAILSNLLDYEARRTDNDPKYRCDSTGFEASNDEKIPIDNRAKVYHGTHKGLNYMVIEKCGRPVNGDVGNRGKRDSQIMLLQLLNKIQNNHTLPPESPRHRDLNELEKAIHDALVGMGFPLTSDRAVGELEGLDEVKYLMAVDADTRLSNDSITQMVYSMESKPKTLALCGETRVENKNDSWVTKIQVFEYYTNHGLKKAFESMFGTVTCLPGCFTMYRLSDRRVQNLPPQRLFACDYVYDRYAKNDAEIETLHEKNLYKLGEDRMLTTLLLQKFPQMNLKYVPEAHCYTIVPDKFSVLLSQRRRWVNSTFHNMLYLLRVGLGGICCCSMKFVVILDMIGTLILPSSLLYVGIMMYNTIFGGSKMSMITLLVFGFSISVQLIAPLLRLKFKLLWSAIIYYIVGVPVFYFVLPIYSFWHLDDFSWGTTRQLASATATDDPNKATSDDTLDEEEQEADEANQAEGECASNNV